MRLPKQRKRINTKGKIMDFGGRTCTRQQTPLSVERRGKGGATGGTVSLKLHKGSFNLNEGRPIPTTMVFLGIFSSLSADLNYRFFGTKK